MPEPKCLICNADLSEEVISKGFTYYKCKECFTSQIFPQPTKKVLDDYYNKFHLNENEGGSYDWIEERMQLDFDAKIKILEKFRTKGNSNLLDVGCGKGYFIAKCNSSGFNAKGIDISVSGIEFAKNKLKVDADRISVEEFSDQPGSRESYSFVTLLATLEHMPDPFLVLNSVNKCLIPGGILFFDTGLGNDRLEKYMTGHSQWYDAPQHLFVFSEKGLRVILKQSGFEIISIDRNFERSLYRKYLKCLRNSFISIASFIVLRPFLGQKGFESMKMESKWPIGKLISITAKKIN